MNEEFEEEQIEVKEEKPTEKKKKEILSLITIAHF